MSRLRERNFAFLTEDEVRYGDFLRLSRRKRHHRQASIFKVIVARPAPPDQVFGNWYVACDIVPIREFNTAPEPRIHDVRVYVSGSAFYDGRIVSAELAARAKAEAP